MRGELREKGKAKLILTPSLSKLYKKQKTMNSMNRYFEVGIRYDKTFENGMQKKVTELYIVESFTFTEAESRIINEMSAYISGEFDVVSMKITKYSKILDKDGTRYYKAKVNTIEIDDRTEKEKKTSTYLLVMADDIEEARKSVLEAYSTSMLDFEIAALQETKIVEVFEYKNKDNNEK